MALFAGKTENLAPENEAPNFSGLSRDGLRLTGQEIITHRKRCLLSVDLTLTCCFTNDVDVIVIVVVDVVFVVNYVYVTMTMKSFIKVDLPSQDHLVSFHLLTILTGQGHISKVVVLFQISKSSTLSLILPKYLI